MLIFRRIFLCNYWWQKSDIWSQASYRYPISWDAFLDLSDSYFLFANERGYHKWALAHSSSCYFCFCFLVWGRLVFSRIFTPVVSGIISVNNVISWILYFIPLLEQRALWFLCSMKNILQKATYPIQCQWPEISWLIVHSIHVHICITSYDSIYYYLKHI